MSLPNELMPVGLLGGGGAYSISRSLRFNSTDSAYLSRTPGSAGNRRTWTWAGWVKRSGFNADNELFAVGPSDGFVIRFTSADIIRIYSYTTSYQLHFQTSSVYRDPAAWYHLVLAVDSTQATEANRAKLYINGIQVTAFATAIYPSQNADLLVNAATRHDIGTNLVWGGSSYLSGYLADIHFIDGQALTPSSFGEFDATTGVWNPKAYSGTYGTNGFRLDFSDNSAATATTLGKDRAGSNNWTPNNLSVTAGAGNDILRDSPTNGTASSGGDVGGVTVGNYCTFSAIDKASTINATNGNLDVIGTGSGGRARATIAVSSGKWYYEFLMNSVSGGGSAGLMSIGARSDLTGSGPSTDLGVNADTWGVFTTGQVQNNNSFGTSVTSISNGDIVMFAVNMDSGKFWYGKNGTWSNSGNPVTDANPVYSNLSGYTIAPGIGHGTGTTASYSFNFGQRPFAYAAPSGFKALCTTNLPTPTILKGSTYFDTNLYTGNGSTQTISGLGFSPDWVWIKGRSGGDHALYDTVRDVQKDLVSNSTAAETTQSTGLTAFNSDGFALGALAKLNTNGATYAAWCWDAGSSNATNTSGSITSTVRANASAGFSVVTFTGSTSVFTVGHGLGVAPAMFIQKGRNTSTAWWVYHSSIGNTGAVRLDGTGATVTAASLWNNTSPTSTVVTLGAGAADASPFLIYAFAPVAGYSAFGSYTGNGSADGAFVYTSFRPAFVLVKNTTTAVNWNIFDNKRSGYNVANDSVQPNSTNGENSGASNLFVDLLSNGFKLRNTYTDGNLSGNTYIYAAFCEVPFNIARAR